MYKTVKIPMKAYENAKLLSKELEEKGELVGVHKVNLSIAISYSVAKMLELLRKRSKFLSAAGGWKDMKEIDKLKKEIYTARKISHREAL